MALQSEIPFFIRMQINHFSCLYYVKASKGSKTAAKDSPRCFYYISHIAYQKFHNELSRVKICCLGFFFKTSNFVFKMFVIITLSGKTNGTCLKT